MVYWRDGLVRSDIPQKWVYSYFVPLSSEHRTLQRSNSKDMRDDYCPTFTTSHCLLPLVSPVALYPDQISQIVVKVYIRVELHLFCRKGVQAELFTLTQQLRSTGNSMTHSELSTGRGSRRSRGFRGIQRKGRTWPGADY